MRNDLIGAKQEIKTLQLEKDEAVASGAEMIKDTSLSGILDRVQALKDYLLTNTMALVFFGLFFIFLVILELTVVIVKLLYGTTADDKIEAMKARISLSKAQKMKVCTLQSLTRII